MTKWFYFFAGQAGWLSPRLIEEILWNRTANLQGGPGRNVALDRVNEFHNNQFKGKYFYQQKY